MRKFAIVFLIVLVISLYFNIVAAVSNTGAEPGSEQDPLVPKSYVDKVVSQYMSDLANLKTQVEALKNQQPTGGSQGFTVITLEAGKTLLTGSGAELVLRSGKATAVAGTEGNLSDVTSAKDLAKGSAVTLNHLLISSRDDGRGLKASVKSYLIIRGSYTVSGQQQVESSITDNGTSQPDSGINQPVDNGSGTSSGSEPPKAKVNTAALNIRSEPDVNSSLLGKIYSGTVVYVLASDGEWVNIKTPTGVTGWVMGIYITMQ